MRYFLKIHTNYVVKFGQKEKSVVMTRVQNVFTLMWGCCQYYIVFKLNG